MDFEETDLGRIEISEAVIRDIAIHSYIEFLKFDPRENKARKEAKSTVDIDLDEKVDGTKTVKITVNTKIKYGVSIPSYARKMQEKLKNDVESFSGLKVEDVSISIEDVYEEPQKPAVIEEDEPEHEAALPQQESQAVESPVAEEEIEKEEEKKEKEV
ncbi:MAG TPA: Asp23/Gls24 family envelope stress response protein [Mesotoga sp.]|jgi:uncharacterized alkaline shock family protein YloU|nr:Asp23/Gls24 family envelope stress response protein [Mesotoga sp.]MDI9374371.1 Asp23/Gls24 family envelope stress response protein [Thermotogota bacterium]NLX33300.1 Asp23/Gls24 family envelope stress response protein [Thermotogaceae bacterium]MDD4040948.1 Asp23/Gls24 family envelope stress response protein [Mesotoga sp.]MDD4478027.1 Asp23/Gls24 family envelope stress response protein [Mesotoga sp.]